VAFNLEGTYRTARDLTRTSQLMQSRLTQVRMRPFSDLVGRFPRALRDMAIEYAKQVELKVTGGEILIDRTILEGLSDPLLHLMRNAFDHGIESPETRLNQGKSPQGTIHLSASYRGNQTIITVQDDGSGINFNKIREKALEIGLDPEDIAKASQNDLLELIFQPGFTTAEQVTDLSGRGVGMDVVRTNLKKIRGQIAIATQPGHGTTVTLTVPFTLSVVRVLLVDSGGLLLAFPTNSIEEMLVPTTEMFLSSAGQEFLNWDGQMVPLIHLNEWLGFNHPDLKPTLEGVPLIPQSLVLIIGQGSHLVGLQVESYWGEQEVTIRNIEGVLTLPSGFTGCTILGDGRVVPLIDAVALLDWIDSDRQTHKMGSKLTLTHLEDEDKFNESFRDRKPMVMIVDDSINVRRFLGLTLEKAGYRVQQAKDGQDAWEKIQAGWPIEAVICDIEMPRLDGYDFLAQIRAQPQFRDLPVIMLTSRGSDKHRQIAMNLGATAYFSKPLQEQELLKSLKSLTKNLLVTSF
jgi:chemotaxis family two-component system sensor histidine kinase/response regulator PixL